MTDLTLEILSLLSPLDATVTAEYPESVCEMPVVTVVMRESAVTARADGEDYLEETTFGVDVYAATDAETRSLARDADALLSAYGLRRTGYQRLYDQGARVHRAAMTYRGVMRADTIYQ